MHLVVIGGVAAGMSAASRARRLDRDIDISVFERSSVVSYGTCGLPYWIEGTVRSAEDLVVHSPDFFERERNIHVRVNTPVKEISPARRRVVLSSGEEVSFDRLIIATGASAHVPDLPGTSLPHVFVFRTWDEAHRLEAFLRERNPRNAVIIGAGFVGLELAEALKARGLHTTLLDRSSHFLGWPDEWLSAQIRERLESSNVVLRLGQTIGKIHEEGVDDLPADLVLLASGIVPNVQLAEDAGIRLGRSGAIAVNEFLETSCSGIYAAGDCAETHHLLLNSPDWIPLGTTANKMGRVAGANAVGQRERFPGVVGTAIVRVCGMAVGVTGLSEAAARAAGFQPVSASISARARASYFSGENVRVKLIADRNSGRLLGGAIVGMDGVEGRLNVLATAVTAGVSAESFQFMDLCYAPPYATVWDPLLIAAQQILKELG